MTININWMFLPFDRHLDGGFGTMASSFKESADCLVKADDRPQSSDYVICYMFRHSIELSLKSMILILHRSQNIPFPAQTKRGDPKIHSGKALYGTHSLVDLYEHFEKTITDNWDAIKQPEWTEWSDIPAVISDGIPRADRLDPGSFGFRYPDTDDPASDPKGPGRLRPFEQLVSDMRDDSKPAQKTLVMVDDDHNVVESFAIDPVSMADEISFLAHLANDLTAAAFGMHCEMANAS